MLFVNTPGKNTLHISKKNLQKLSKTILPTTKINPIRINTRSRQRRGTKNPMERQKTQTKTIKLQTIPNQKLQEKHSPKLLQLNQIHLSFL